MSVRETIARNTGFNALGRVWEALVSLALIAYIVSQIGIAQYGLWGVIAAFTGYAALFDLGVGSAYTKYIAEHDARDEKEEISRIVSTGFFFYALFGAVFVAIAWPAVDLLLGIVERMGETASGDLARPEVLADMRFLLRWGLVLFAVSNCIMPFTSVQTGLQRMGVTNAISVGVSFVKIGATLYFLESGYGVRGLLYANALVLVVFGMASVTAAFVLCPSLRLSVFRISRSTFKRLFSFGWRTQVSRLSNLIMFETDVLVITFILRDLQLAGLYKIGIELANKARQVPSALLTALVPAVSGLDATNEDEKLQRLYVKSTKYVAALTVPVLAFVAGAAGLLMSAWQGTALELGAAVIVLRMMAFGYVANVLPGPGVTVALGTGRPDVQMKAGLISMTSNVVMTVGLVYTIGFWGVPIATVVSMFLSWGWFTGAMKSLVGIGAKELFAQAIRWPLVSVLPAFLFCAVADRLSGQLTSRIESLAAVVVVLVVFSVLYLAMLRRTPFFDAEDLDFFDNTLRLRRVPGYAAWTRAMREGETG
ncbi:MAG: flippase [Candidatus Hydrogenedentes bacterium]|nr:flippase [Candidatus Hydrogenedentota bacterium]